MNTDNISDSKKYKDATIGADIEFCVTDIHKVIDPKNHHLKVVNYGDMGWDGGGATQIFELRPNASLNPLDLNNNIYGILFNKIKRNPEFLKYTYHAGACYKDKFIGAHLHYGLSKEDKAAMDYEHITTMFDNYVGLLSILLEDREQGLKRRKNGYGLTGKENEPFRLQPHGAEYRVCSSFLVSPQVTNAFTCLFKVLVYEYLNNKDFGFKMRNFENDFFAMDISKLRTFYPAIWSDIQRMQLYPKYRVYIDLINILISKNLGWTPRKLGVKEAWGIIDISKREKEERSPYTSISMESIWSDRPKKFSWQKLEKFDPDVSFDEYISGSKNKGDSFYD